MRRSVTHFGRNTAIATSAYAALVAVSWVALGLGGAVIAAVGGAAVIALFVPAVFIHYEEAELLYPRRRTAGR